MAEADATLHDPDFCMKFHETFDLFLAKFTATIAPLGLTDTQKISALKRTITYELAEKISDGQRATSFKDFATRLRQIDVDLRHFRRQNRERSSSRTTTYSRGRRSRRSCSQSGKSYSRCSSSSTTSSHPDAYPEDFKQQLLKEGRCLKCIHKGHLPTDEKAPCKHTQSMTYKEAKAARSLLARGMARCHKKE